MPLSKARDRERKRLIRLHRRLRVPLDIGAVQPKTIEEANEIADKILTWLVADGNPVYDD